MMQIGNNYVLVFTDDQNYVPPTTPPGTFDLLFLKRRVLIKLVV